MPRFSQSAFTALATPFSSGTFDVRSVIPSNVCLAAIFSQTRADPSYVHPAARRTLAASTVGFSNRGTGPCHTDPPGGTGPMIGVAYPPRTLTTIDCRSGQRVFSEQQDGHMTD